MAKRWYVLHVFSGSEKKVAQLITEQAESNGLDHQIEEVMVPTCLLYTSELPTTAYV